MAPRSEYSTNGTTWTTLTSVSGVTDNAYTQVNFGGVSARYIRLTMSSASLSLGDFMIFGQATAPTVSAVSTAVANSSSSNPVVLNVTGVGITGVTVASGPSHGTATVSGTTITYTPNAGYSGADSFTYTATNAKGTSTAATASITVNAPVMVAPTANAVTAAVSFGLHQRPDHSQHQRPRDQRRRRDRTRPRNGQHRRDVDHLHADGRLLGLGQLHLHGDQLGRHIVRRPRSASPSTPPVRRRSWRCSRGPRACRICRTPSG